MRIHHVHSSSTILAVTITIAISLMLVHTATAWVSPLSAASAAAAASSRGVLSSPLSMAYIINPDHGDTNTSGSSSDSDSDSGSSTRGSRTTTPQSPPSSSSSSAPVIIKLVIPNGSETPEGLSIQAAAAATAAATAGNADATIQKNEFTGAGTLGDIMSDDECDDDYDDHDGNSSSSRRGPSKAGLVTLAGGTLAARFGIQSPLDRMALTANGNLQRLFSSFYDAPIHVVVKQSQQQQQLLPLLSTPTQTQTLSNDTRNIISDGSVWDRIVHLTVFNEVFCVAHSTVTIHDPQCQQLVESGQVGLGQLFRYLDRLPTFELIDAGYNATDPTETNTASGGLWRLYELRCKEVSCRIREDFHPRAWEMIPSVSSEHES